MAYTKSISVYCASSTQIDDAYVQAAFELGKLMAAEGYRLIYGGGQQGLMGAVARGVLSNGGEAVGVIPHFMVEEGWHHRHLTELIEVEDMSARKKLMEQISDGCIALPGSVGTFDELMEVVALKKLGLYLKPVVVLNTCDFYAPLKVLLQKTVDEHFMHPGHLELCRFVDTPVEVMEFLRHAPKLDAHSIQEIRVI